MVTKITVADVISLIDKVVLIRTTRNSLNYMSTNNYSVTPAQILLTTTVVVSFSIIILAPIDQLQTEFWLLFAVTFVAGDSITTGLLGKYGLKEGGQYTKRVCGEEPSLTCATTTRILAFIGLIGTYFVVPHIIHYPLLVYSMPVVFGIASVVGVILNSVGIIQSARADS